MIDPQKSIVIFTYPRSGSTWFQDKLPHYNLQEMMNYNVKFKFTREGLSFNRAYWTDRPPLDVILRYRVEMLRYYYRNFSPVSLKIQTRYLQPQIHNVLHELDFQYVALRRRNMHATVWSYLITMCTNEWGGAPTAQTITISREIFDEVDAVLRNYDLELQQLQSQYPITTVYYEDALQWTPCEWWRESTNITVQNAKAITTVANRDEVENWLTTSGYV